MAAARLMVHRSSDRRMTLLAIATRGRDHGLRHCWGFHARGQQAKTTPTPAPESSEARGRRARVVARLERGPAAGCARRRARSTWIAGYEPSRSQGIEQVGAPALGSRRVWGFV